MVHDVVMDGRIHVAYAGHSWDSVVWVLLEHTAALLLRITAMLNSFSC